MKKVITTTTTVVEELVDETPPRMIVTLCLDQTGSMHAIKDDTIGGFNAYVDSLKKLPNEVYFTLIKFDSQSIDTDYVAKPIAKVPHLDTYSYLPRGGTNLYDAAMQAIFTTECFESDYEGAKVVVVIQTDGEENASIKYKKAELTDKIKEKRAEGWEFVFLGCGVDAFKEGTSLGISASNAFSYGIHATAATFDTLASATRSYAASTSATLDMGVAAKKK